MKFNGETGKRGVIGICPRCGNGEIVWDAETDISRCSCGWHNDVMLNKEQIEVVQNSHWLVRDYIRKLIEEKERCLDALSELSNNIGLLKDKAKTDTVQKMTDMLKQRLPIISPSVFDQIAKAVLEENK